jgi:hypothetical protein
MAWLRWLFFILGTFGPAIKLMVMSGVPYTKGGGAMFLTSFLIVEILIIISWNLDQRPLHFETEIQESLQSMRATLKVMDEFLHALACFAHILLMIWASFFLVNGRSIFEAFQYHWSVFQDWQRLPPETSEADRLQILRPLVASFLGLILLAPKLLDPHTCVLWNWFRRNDRTKAAEKILNVWTETFFFYRALAEAFSNFAESEQEWWPPGKYYGLILAITCLCSIGSWA